MYELDLTSARANHQTDSGTNGQGLLSLATTSIWTACKSPFLSTREKSLPEGTITHWAQDALQKAEVWHRHLSDEWASDLI